MPIEKIILVTRKTRLQGLIERFNTVAQARFYIEHSGGNFGFYQKEHDVYYQGLEVVRRQLKQFQKTHEIERTFLPNYIFTDHDLVVTFGIDGLVVNAAKYLTGQPLVAVNPDPDHIDGILLPYTIQTMNEGVKQVIESNFKAKPITMAKVVMNDGQELLAFNDFFVGIGNHTSARYTLSLGNIMETQSSSGVIISTGAGSTGWLSSFYNFTNGMVRQLTGQATFQIQPPVQDWSSDRLFYIVREPFASKTSATSMVCGWIQPDSPLKIQSHMSQEGVIFSDGVEKDYLAFNAGAVATIGIADKKTNLIIPVD
jgi:NAD kinase